MKILVIGSGGQLGTDCMKLLDTKHDVIGVDYPGIDIADSRSVAAVFNSATPDIAINCAAYTAVDLCETERDTAWKINADGPRFIAESAEAGHCRLIHISTDYVFDGKKPVPEQYCEGDQVNPLSEYGRSKLQGEKNVAAVMADCVILRTAWLYSGYGGNFLKTMLRLALSDPDRPFTVVNDQYGSLTWSYSLAKQIEKLIETGLSGIIHTTSTGYSSWFEAACYFLEKMDVPHAFVPCTSEEYPTPAHRPANSILKNGVLEEHGISVFPCWQEDVERFVAQFREPLLAEVKQLLKG
ncbi:MAG: dTDP-4-dehydrorhamnose reductase [Proteobacteria bacterium]|nr:MAG: dTDP-4-dehydrorhamnose reductase [Pseudomonadota bacterium]